MDARVSADAGEVALDRSPLAVAQRYFDAWNRRDPGAILDTFSADGTYEDAASGGALSGPAIAGYAAALFAGFPDLAFEVVMAETAGAGRVAAQWIMRGTNSGSLGGNPPTGRAVELPGADFLTVADGAVRSVRGYFDQKAFLEQLGLQVLAVPSASGPVAFGYSVRLDTGSRVEPGAFSTTFLHVRSDAEVQEVQGYSRRILMELGRMPGVISAVIGTVGHLMFTTVAWADAESPRQLLREGAHKEAMARFFGPDFTLGGSTSVWTPHHVRMWVRCAACGTMSDTKRAGGQCPCGQALPEALAYW